MMMMMMIRPEDLLGSLKRVFAQIIFASVPQRRTGATSSTASSSSSSITAIFTTVSSHETPPQLVDRSSVPGYESQFQISFRFGRPSASPQLLFGFRFVKFFLQFVQFFFALPHFFV